MLLLFNAHNLSAMVKNKISMISKILLIFSSVILLISIFVPIWRIELGAPQYPEGLVLLIFSSKLGGNVDIINGLNHYIGMQTLHEDNFIEFTILPYLIGFFVLFTLSGVFVGRKKFLYFIFAAFVAFCIIAMVDFWRWEYNYGHNLDPNAAIIVPGMAYQPPLIGFKQLLNFGAYSVPDIGGILFIISGLLMLIAVILEIRKTRKGLKSKVMTSIILCLSIFFNISCNSGNPEPIKLNKDNCSFCKMTISDGKFGCEMVTSKGRVYKFDDISCMFSFKKEHTDLAFKNSYVSDYQTDNILIPAESAFYIKSKEIKSPMQGNTAAFRTKEKAEDLAKKISSSAISWLELNAHSN